jgi:hypothetical protein
MRILLSQSMQNAHASFPFELPRGTVQQVRCNFDETLLPRLLQKRCSLRQGRPNIRLGFVRVQRSELLQRVGSNGGW